DGYISTNNPWSTSHSAFFPNGITTAGSTNWIYGGTTYIGNAPGNGFGHQFSASAGASHVYLGIGGGNVGIGTTSPDVIGNSIYGTQFSVNGGTSVIGSIAVGGNGTAGYVGGYQFFNNSLGTSDKRIAAIVSRTDGATNSGDLEFITWNAGTPVERMHLSANGNVGIGTASPQTPLNVNLGAG